MRNGLTHALASALLGELAEAVADLDKRAAEPRKRKKAFYLSESLRPILARRPGWEQLTRGTFRHQGGAVLRISRYDDLYTVAERVLRAEAVSATRRASRRAQRQAVATALKALRAEGERREAFERLPL